MIGVITLALLGSAAAMTEPKTGISFSDKKGMSSLSRVGVRYKGPIKVRTLRKCS